VLGEQERGTEHLLRAITGSRNAIMVWQQSAVGAAARKRTRGDHRDPHSHALKQQVSAHMWNHSHRQGSFRAGVRVEVSRFSARAVWSSFGINFRQILPHPVISSRD
jgi:hypothetical protein